MKYALAALALIIMIGCTPDTTIVPTDSRIQGTETNVQLDGQVEFCLREPESILCTGGE